MRVATHLKPEFRRVVGEGRRMACDQLVVAPRRLGAPFGGLIESANLVQDAGERCRVIGIVGGGRQRTQPGKRGLGLAQGGLDLGQVTLGRSEGRQAAMRGAEPSAGAMEIALRQPHQAALEVEQRQRKWQDPPVLANQSYLNSRHSKRGGGRLWNGFLCYGHTTDVASNPSARRFRHNRGLGQSGARSAQVKKSAARHWPRPLRA
jgi:hypothetical protein